MLREMKWGSSSSRVHFLNNHFPLGLQVSGIDGPNGWALSNTVLDNQFYEELVGGGPGDPVEVLVNDAPEWQRIRRNDKRFWLGRPNGVEVVMVRCNIFCFTKNRALCLEKDS